MSYSKIQQSTEGTQAVPKREVTCDQEAWLLDRLRHIVETTLAIQKCSHARIDGSGLDMALDGLIHGTADEIIRLLDLSPINENIKTISSVRSMFF